MPKQGFTTITVSDQTHQVLKDFAEKTHRSVPQVIEYLMEQMKKSNPSKGADSR